MSENRIDQLSAQLASKPQDVSLLLERAIEYNRLGDRQSAVNDLLLAQKQDPNNSEVQVYLQMWMDIYDYRYMERLNV